MKTSIAVILLTVLACGLAFQNCSQRADFAQDAGDETIKSLTRNEESGNGSGYTGKAEYIARDLKNECLDKSGVHSRIDLANDNKFYLVKENCRFVPAREVFVTLIPGLDPARPLELLYGGLVFEDAANPAASIAYELRCTSLAGNTQLLPGDALSGGISTLLAPSGQGAWIVKGCDLTGRCSIKKNCVFDSYVPGLTLSLSGDADCRSLESSYATPRGQSFSLGMGNALGECAVTRK